MKNAVYTMGYQKWQTEKRLDKIMQAVKKVGVTTLVDIRHSPCSSNLDAKSNYGPRDWHLRTEDRGLAFHLDRQGIEYRWLLELGNPQKNDLDMAVLRAHIASADEKWPVNRGLNLLLQCVQDKHRRCCLLCACEKYDECHRKVIAETLRTRFFEGALEISDLS